MPFPVPSACVYLHTHACACIDGVEMTTCASVYISALLLYHSKCGSQTSSRQRTFHHQLREVNTAMRGLETSTIRQRQLGICQADDKNLGLHIVYLWSFFIAVPLHVFHKIISRCFGTLRKYGHFMLKMSHKG